MTLSDRTTPPAPGTPGPTAPTAGYVTPLPAPATPPTTLSTASDAPNAARTPDGRLTVDLDAIEQRANAATPGPWTWDVNLKSRQMALEGRGRGNETVLGFARWGMNGARALLRRAVTHPGQRTWYRLDNADAFAVPIPGREHHEHWARDLDHPDAEFIARARTDVPALVAECRRLASENARLREDAARWAFVRDHVLGVQDDWQGRYLLAGVRVFTFAPGARPTVTSGIDAAREVTP